MKNAGHSPTQALENVRQGQCRAVGESVITANFDPRQEDDSAIQPLSRETGRHCVTATRWFVRPSVFTVNRHILVRGLFPTQLGFCPVSQRVPRAGVH